MLLGCTRLRFVELAPRLTALAHLFRIGIVGNGADVILVRFAKVIEFSVLIFGNVQIPKAAAHGVGCIGITQGKLLQFLRRKHLRKLLLPLFA